MAEGKKGLFDWYFKSNLLMRILIGLILGAIVGIIFASVGGEGVAKATAFIKPFGDAFIRLLKMIIVPVVLFSLIVGCSSIPPSKLGRVGAKIMIYYIITTFCAAILGLIFALVTQPGRGISLSVGNAAAKEAAPTSMSKVILDIIPENIFQALSQGVILQIIFFALLAGIALAFMRDSKKENIKKSAELIYSFFEGMSEIIFTIVRWIMQYAPIGVFSLMVMVFAINGSKVVGPLIKVTVIVYIALIVHLFLVYGGILLTRKIGIVGFVKKARAPMITAFVTRSSGGTLPLSSACADKMGVAKGVYSFTLPVGATINMDGTTIYQAICAVFIANAVGQPLDVAQMVMVVLTAVLASVGTAGVPGAGALMLLLVLESVGLKVEAGSAIAAAYAMILGIDALLDMGRTGLNVTGDIAGSVLVADIEGELDRAKYDAYAGD